MIGYSLCAVPHTPADSALMAWQNYRTDPKCNPGASSQAEVRQYAGMKGPSRCLLVLNYQLNNEEA